MNHPKRGTSINKIKSQAKTPEMRNTPLKKGRWVLLKVGSIVTTIDKVKIHTSIIKSNMSAPCVSNRDTSGL